MSYGFAWEAIGRPHGTPPVGEIQVIQFMQLQCGRDSELVFPIKDAASAALMLIKADCLHTAGIINGAEKQYVHSRAHTFLDDATLKEAAFLKSHAAYSATISLAD
jgi:hypothetical protein